MHNLGLNSHVTVSHLGVLDETTERFRILLIIYGSGITGYFINTALFFKRLNKELSLLIAVLGSLSGVFIALAGIYRYNLSPFEHNFFAFLYFSLSIMLMIIIGIALKNSSKSYFYSSFSIIFIMLFEMILSIILGRFLFFSEMSFVGLFLIWAVITTIITGQYIVKLDKKSSNT